MYYFSIHIISIILYIFLHLKVIEIINLKKLQFNKFKLSHLKTYLKNLNESNLNFLCKL